jgi:hypothetical protein
MYITRIERPPLPEASHIVSRAFPGIPQEGLEEDTAAHLVGTVYSYYAGERLVGFSSYIMGQSVLYLAGIALDPSVQGKGIALRSMRQASQEHNKPYMGLVTQNPCMARSLFKVGAEVSFDTLDQSTKHEVCELSSVPHLGAPIHFGRYPANGLYGADGPALTSDSALNARLTALPTDAGHLFVARTAL